MSGVWPTEKDTENHGIEIELGNGGRHSVLRVNRFPLLLSRPDCGSPAATPNPVRESLRYWGEEVISGLRRQVIVCKGWSLRGKGWLTRGRNHCTFPVPVP